MSDKYCILQDDLKDCGVCSLLSIIKYYHGDMPKEYLRELTKTNKSGVSAVQILKAARSIGFEAYGLKGKVKDLTKYLLPIIAHVTIDKKFNHFVVIYEIEEKKDKILVMDPARGYITYQFLSFQQISTDYYICLKPKQKIPQIVMKNDFNENLKVLLIKYKTVGIIILFLSFIYTILNVVNSFQFKLLFDDGLLSNNSLLIIFIFLIFLVIVKCLINFLRLNLISNLNFILDKSLVYNAFNHIINLPYLYYKNHTNGDLLTRINDLANIKELLSNFLIGICVDLVLALIILFVMIKINLILSLIVIICLIVYGLISFIGNKLLKKNIRENYYQSGMVNNYLVESLASFESIKNLSIQNYILKNFKRKYNEFSINKEKIIKKVNYENLFKNNILLICNLLILYRGFYLIQDGNLTIFLLITFTSLSSYLIEPIKNLFDLFLVFQNTKESVRRIKEIYNVPEEEMLTKKNNINYLEGRIDVNCVSYSYNGIDKNLDKVSFEINEKEKVLICGCSGCGKSTIIKLLIKYLDNNYDGNITIDGYDLKDIDIHTLRKNICYTSQNEFLYTNSVYENITLGRKIKYGDFLKICKNLSVDEIVKRSNLGYEYMIENDGENISGGEKSRILIARSIISKYNIYIYDETFSAIDPQKEREILKYLFDSYNDKTFIIISHRASNVDLYDKKIVLGEMS